MQCAQGKECLRACVNTLLNALDIDIFIESDNKREVAMLHDRYQEEILRKISPIILDASEFRNLEVKDRPLYERINMGKVIHEA
jgi:hypothetical protein